MYEWNIDLIEKLLIEEINNGDDEAELFHEIHCGDPTDRNKEFVFPLVAVHSSGLYLAHLLNRSKGQPEDLRAELEYVCRVFRSYFITTAPIHSVFAFETYGPTRMCKGMYVYDHISKKMITNEIGSAVELQEYIKQHVQGCDCHCSDEDRDELLSRLEKEGYEPLSSDPDGDTCFIKKGDKWVPAYNLDSNRIFNLALFGGLFGVHRFYMGFHWSGLLYLVTLGVFGFGWFFDCLEMILGYWKRKGIYLLPLTNRARQLLKFFIVFGVIGAVLFSV